MTEVQHVETQELLQVAIPVLRSWADGQHACGFHGAGAGPSGGFGLGGGAGHPPRVVALPTYKSQPGLGSSVWPQPLATQLLSQPWLLVGVGRKI